MAAASPSKVKDAWVEAVPRKGMEMFGWNPGAVSRRPLQAEMLGTAAGLSRDTDGGATRRRVTDVLFTPKMRRGCASRW